MKHSITVANGTDADNFEVVILKCSCGWKKTDFPPFPWNVPIEDITEAAAEHMLAVEKEEDK